MDFVTPTGYLAKETWDCDSCQSNIDVYEDEDNSGFVCTLYGKSFCNYEDEDGNIDGEALDSDILDELNP